MRQVHIRKIKERFGRSKAAALVHASKGRDGKYILLEEADFVRIMNKSIHGGGDVVKKVAKATGIDKLVKKALPNCNCNKRQKKLNQILPL